LQRLGDAPFPIQGGLERVVRALLLGHVLEREQDHPGVVAGAIQFAGVQEERARADGGREHVFQREIVEVGACGQDRLKKMPQRRDVPLAAAQVVKGRLLGVLGRNRERGAKGAVGGHHAQIGVQHEERLTHGIHDAAQVVALFG
jgi:hypothetical protein